MKWVDLHIHTALSPCASDDMTPNNIVNMALLKGLEAIAITDHNSSLNVRAVMGAAKGKIKVIPGVEVQTKEDVHLLCLFKNYDDLNVFNQQIYRHLPSINNREDIFGNQLIMDCDDNVIGKEKKLLLNAVDLSLEEICDCACKNGGISIPAHVDRQGYGILYQLGFIPGDLGFTYIEVSRECDVAALLSSYPDIARYHIIRSSDAHQLGDILEREECSFISIPIIGLD